MILRSVVFPLLVLSAVAAAVGAVVVGRDGALAGALGGVLVVLFLATSPWLLDPVARRAPELSLPYALALFAAKAVAAIVVVSVLVAPDGPGRFVHAPTLGGTVVVTSLVCTALQFRAFRRSRVPTYDLGNNP